eukprot:jgi/Botrbrau1/8461/Bobra.0237s0078.1
METFRLVGLCVLCATFFATLSSVRQLANLIEQQQSASLRSKHRIEATGRTEWSEVIDRAEENIEHNLPSWLRKDEGRWEPSPRQSAEAAQKALRGRQTGVQGAEGPPQRPSGTAARQRVPVSATASPGGQCAELQHTDYWGEALKWGSKNRKNSSWECCEDCRRYQPPNDDSPSCNVWVWCGDKEKCGDQYQDCWLKHLDTAERESNVPLPMANGSCGHGPCVAVRIPYGHFYRAACRAHPGASNPKTGSEIPWTSGLTEDLKLPQVPAWELGREYHTVISAAGSATHWQSRVGYYHFLKVKKQCQQEHGSRYIVLNRPWAFVQWVKEAKIKEKYVLMSEPDHIWLKPMPNLMVDDRPAAFPFFYIEPSKREHRHITEKFTGRLTLKQAESIAPIGNAPTMMSFEQLAHVAETWMNVTHQIFDDEEAHKEWGWVQEMYGFTIACYNAGIGKIEVYSKMMAQPPWDTKMEPYYILHYTYGNDYSLNGTFTPGQYGEWRFDKRTYARLPPPRNLGQPPPGMKNELVRYLINAINEASNAIPGWDEYAETGHATQFWDGTFPESSQ